MPAKKFGWPTSAIGMLNPFAPSGKARKRADEFVAFAQAASAGKSYEEAKLVFKVSHQQAETRKSMLEEMGLVYVPHGSQQIFVTPVGEQLLELLTTSNYEKNADDRKRVAAVLAWALSNSQINRPQSRGTPKPTTTDWQTCEIRPYAATWQALSDLGGHLTVDEFFGVLSHIHKVGDYVGAIDTIKQARAGAGVKIDPKWYRRGGELFNQRIYWKSHLSGGGALLRVEKEEFSFLLETSEIIRAALAFADQCGQATPTSSFEAKPYTSTQDYFVNVAGRACPSFLFSGRVRVVNVGTEPIAILEGYTAQAGDPYVTIEGGSELCTLALNAPCYHELIPLRLLRLASKTQLPNGGVRLKLALARPLKEPLTNN